MLRFFDSYQALHVMTAMTLVQREIARLPPKERYAKTVRSSQAQVMWKLFDQAQIADLPQSGKRGSETWGVEMNDQQVVIFRELLEIAVHFQVKKLNELRADTQQIEAITAPLKAIIADFTPVE